MVGHFEFLARFLSNRHLVNYLHSNTMCEHAPGGFCVKNLCRRKRDLAVCHALRVRLNALDARPTRRRPKMRVRNKLSRNKLYSIE